jgi:hypothetical protein
MIYRASGATKYRSKYINTVFAFSWSSLWQSFVNCFSRLRTPLIQSVPSGFITQACTTRLSYLLNQLQTSTIMGGGISVFPVANSTLLYWRSEPHEIDSHRSTKQLPSECDVLIVGAGISGVSTAYHLLNDNATPPPPPRCATFRGQRNMFGSNRPEWLLSPPTLRK